MRITTRALIPVFAIASVTLISGCEIDEVAPDIEIFDVAAGGNGCPEAMASATLSDDKRTLSVTLTGAAMEIRRYAACTIAVSLSVPADISLRLRSVEYRGEASVPNRTGESGELDARHYFAGALADGTYTLSHVFPPGYDGSYVLESPAALPVEVATPCGAQPIFNASVALQGVEWELSIDEADFTFDWSEC